MIDMARYQYGPYTDLIDTWYLTRSGRLWHVDGPGVAGVREVHDAEEPPGLCVKDLIPREKGNDYCRLIAEASGEPVEFED